MCWRSAGTPRAACGHPKSPELRCKIFGRIIYETVTRRPVTHLLGCRGDCVTITTLADQTAQVMAKLMASAAELTIPAEAVTGLLELARITAESGRTGNQDLN